MCRLLSYQAGGGGFRWKTARRTCERSYPASLRQEPRLPKRSSAGRTRKATKLIKPTLPARSTALPVKESRSASCPTASTFAEDWQPTSQAVTCPAPESHLAKRLL